MFNKWICNSCMCVLAVYQHRIAVLWYNHCYSLNCVACWLCVCASGGTGSLSLSLWPAPLLYVLLLVLPLNKSLLLTCLAPTSCIQTGWLCFWTSTWSAYNLRPVPLLCQFELCLWHMLLPFFVNDSLPVVDRVGFVYRIWSCSLVHMLYIIPIWRFWMVAGG